MLANTAVLEPGCLPDLIITFTSCVTTISNSSSHSNALHFGTLHLVCGGSRFSILQDYARPFFALTGSDVFLNVLRPPLFKW